MIDEVLDEVLIGTGFVLAAFFPAYALARADILRNPPGRAMLLFSIIVALVLGLAFFRRLGLDLPQWVGLAAYGIIALGLVTLDVTLVRTQRRRSARLTREAQEDLR